MYATDSTMSSPTQSPSKINGVKSEEEGGLTSPRTPTVRIPKIKKSPKPSVSFAECSSPKDLSKNSFEVGGHTFEEGKNCPFCQLHSNEAHRLDATTGRAHLIDATHRTAMIEFKAYLGDDLPDEVTQLYNKMMAATKAVTMNDPYAFVALMKKRVTVSNDAITHDQPTASSSSSSTPSRAHSGSLEGLPSPSLFQAAYNDNDEQKEYIRRNIKVSANQGRLMSQSDWSLFDTILRREGIEQAMHVFHGVLICQDCDKKLPYEKQIVEHLRSPGHKNVLRNLLAEMEGPNTPIQRRNWAEATHRPSSRKRGQPTPADPRRAKRHQDSSGKIAWPCLNCRSTCIASKNAKHFVCSKCQVAQKPQM